jgi:hypothetical protein
MTKKRDYKREYAKTDSKPKAKKQRAAANRARRKLGLKKGDPRHAGHIKRGGGEGKGNIRPQSAKSNMSHGGKVGSKKGKAAGGRKSKRT